MKTRPVWAEIDLKAIAHNMREIRRVTSPGARVMAIVKSNAYGHGALRVSETVLANGADRLAVATLDEARILRAGGITAPIMILGYTPGYQAEEVVALDLIQAVYDRQTAEHLSQAAVSLGKRVKIHIKVDTGLGRLGFGINDTDLEEIKKITELPHLETEGIFSHFAVADTKDKSYTNQQLSKFTQTVDSLKSLGVNFPIRHLANSAGIIDLPQTHLEMVRPGISIYGYYPSDEVDRNKLDLKPALALKCEVAFCKELQEGSFISYGCTYTTRQRETIATLPLGYADGYTRLLTGKAEVLVKGQRASVVGRICMDACMAEVTHIPGVKIGDEVVLIGSQGNEKLTADDLARQLGTISYEILCMISWRVPRVYLD